MERPNLMATADPDPAAPASDRDATSRAERTRALLIDVAEDQFARHGLAGASLREIARLAGCGNTGAVRYHFGDREGLVSAVFRARLGPFEAQRAAALAAAMADDAAPGLHALLDILMRPFERQRGLSGQRSYAALLAALARTGEIAAWLRFGANLPASNRIIALLRARVPALDDSTFHRRMTLLATMIWSGLAEQDRMAAAGAAGDDEAVFADLIAMAAAALAA